MTWLGSLFGIMGCRTIQSGSHAIKPPRNLPRLLLRQERSLVLIPERGRWGKITNSRIADARLSKYRSFWTWRGGDEKKWKFRDGSEESSVSDEEDGVSITEVDSERTISLTYKQSFLSNPSAYPISVCTAQGFRSYMEDEFFYSQDGEFAAVFDGHGGQAVSRYLKKNLYANVQAFLPATTTTSSGTTTEPTTDHEQPLKRASASVQDYENAIISALDKVDREVQRISHWSYQGSTAVAIWLHEERKILAENESPSILKTIIAANVGDSRAVLCRNNTAYDLTRDHKPDDPLEQARIEALGGEVVWCGDRDKVGDPILERGIYRVNGNLALSRAIGDRSERPHVTAEPEIISATIVDGDDFIIVATDGLWDVFDSDDAVHYVLSLRTDGHQLERIATFVVEEALRRGTYDNITVVIIWLDRKKSN